MFLNIKNNDTDGNQKLNSQYKPNKDGCVERLRRYSLGKHLLQLVVVIFYHSCVWQLE